MSKTVKILAIVISLFLTASAVSAQNKLKGSWKNENKTKAMTRSGEMFFTTDGKEIKSLTFDTSFYIFKTKNYHECAIAVSRDDGTSKWTTKGSVTKVIDADDNETIITKTGGGWTIYSGCDNTTFYKIAFTRRGDRYVGREIK